MRILFLGALSSLLMSPCIAQTIRVDAAPEHFTNTIRPTQALGAGMDRLPYGAADKLFNKDTIDRIHGAGWQMVTYRQNTELHAEAWHWNPRGTWSEPAERGYFVGDSAAGSESISHSYGYPLPRRGVTRDDGTDTIGYSRLTDGDQTTFWKSNPYLTHAFTGQDDAAHPQWVIVDLAAKQDLQAMRIDWAEPYATKYVVQFWTGEDPIRKPAAGTWQAFPRGQVIAGAGGSVTLRLSDAPVAAQFVRILMSASSNTCVDANHSDVRNCVGYAIREVSLGSQSSDGDFHDLLRHTPDQDQTPTYCSSIDPWHQSGDLDEQAGDQVGFDRFFTSGLTRGLPAMIPIAMLYSTPADAVAELRYLERRGYPVSYVEMGEEPDGHYTVPEDYAELYLQFAAALHQFDPTLKLGGPIFTGQNEDIQSWADGNGKVSWTGRFISYLKARGKLDELAFFSFEHYPIDAGKISWSNLYDESRLVTHIMKVWRDDGVPSSVPLFITESNLSSQFSEAYMDLWGGLWLADYIGAFLTAGGNAVYYFHDMPLAFEPGHNGSPGTFSLFSTDRDLNLKQPLSQYFVSQLINLEWLEPGSGEHRLSSATGDISDGAGHSLVTAYPAKRPDGSWAILVINKDQNNAHKVNVRFDDSIRHQSGGFTGTVSQTVFGSTEYHWHPDATGGFADPDGPPSHSAVPAGPDTLYLLPPASVTVLRGTVKLSK
jgi:hypothetical protein